jgi:hypothetical protein
MQRLVLRTFAAPTGVEDARAKVYRITAEGLSLFATGGGYSNVSAGPSAFSPLISGDGSITGYARHVPCGGSCIPPAAWASKLTRRIFS